MPKASQARQILGHLRVSYSGFRKPGEKDCILECASELKKQEGGGRPSVHGPFLSREAEEDKCANQVIQPQKVGGAEGGWGQVAHTNSLSVLFNNNTLRRESFQSYQQQQCSWRAMSLHLGF